MATQTDREQADAEARTNAALTDAPPFQTWRKISGFVVAVLGAEIVIFATLTHVMK